MYISFYFKLTMNCMKKQGVCARKKKKFLSNCVYKLKIAQNVSKIATIEKMKYRSLLTINICNKIQGYNSHPRQFLLADK